MEQIDNIFEVEVLDNNEWIGHWHNEYGIRLSSKNKNYFYLSPVYIKGMITGCGLMQLEGFTSLSRLDKTQINSFLTALSDVKDRLRRNGVGAILATLGQQYYSSTFFNILKDMGFEEISEYNNYRHGRATQKLYICKL